MKSKSKSSQVRLRQTYMGELRRPYIIIYRPVEIVRFALPAPRYLGFCQARRSQSLKPERRNRTNNGERKEEEEEKHCPALTTYPPNADRYIGCHMLDAHTPRSLIQCVPMLLRWMVPKKRRALLGGVKGPRRGVSVNLLVDNPLKRSR